MLYFLINNIGQNGVTDPEDNGKVFNRSVVQTDATFFGSLLVILDGLRSEFTSEHLEQTFADPPPFAIGLKVKVVRLDFAEATFKVEGRLTEVLVAEADPRVPFLRRRDVSLARA